MSSGGQEIPLTVFTIANGYGDNTLVWQPSGLSFSPPMQDRTIDVTVSNIRVNGLAQEHTYHVTVIDPATDPPVPADAFEPNGDFAHAADVASGDQLLPDLTLHQAADVDVFRWTAAANGPLVLGLVTASTGTAWQVSLYDAQPVLLSHAGYQDQPPHIATAVTAGASYFVVVEGDGRSSLANYALSIDGTSPPQAIDDRAATEAGEPVMIDVMANDQFVDVAADPASVRILMPPAHGRVEISPAHGTIRYTPGTGFLGVEQLSYAASDTLENSSSEAIVSITVLDSTARPWQNPRDRLDTTAEGFVTPRDALVLINRLSVTGVVRLQLDLPGGVYPPYYLDVSGDGFLSPVDALLVINYLTRESESEGEAEQRQLPLAAEDVGTVNFGLSAANTFPSCQVAGGRDPAVAVIDDLFCYDNIMSQHNLGVPALQGMSGAIPWPGTARHRRLGKRWRC